jgi:hypothetical protein
MKPGKGITIRRDLIPELKKALTAAEKADKAGPAPAATTNDTKEEKYPSL